MQQSLETVSQKEEIVRRGAKREANTGTDFFIHVFGTALGVLYVFVYRRKSFLEGVRQFASLLPFKPPRGPKRKCGRRRHKSRFQTKA